MDFSEFWVQGLDSLKGLYTGLYRILGLGSKLLKGGYIGDYYSGY